jgi:hypothetical protein
MERGGAEGYSDPKAVGSLHDFSSVRVECAALGASASLGSLSVPPSWPEADKHIEPSGLLYRLAATASPQRSPEVGHQD